MLETPITPCQSPWLQLPFAGLDVLPDAEVLWPYDCAKEFDEVAAHFSGSAVRVVKTFPETFEDAQNVYFLHASTTSEWKGTAVNPLMGRADLDFGPAFYAFKDAQRARIAAMQWAFEVQMDAGGSGIVLRFR